MYEDQHSYSELLEMSQKELQQEARRVLLYYNTILVTMGANMATKASLEGKFVGTLKDE